MKMVFFTICRALSSFICVYTNNILCISIQKNLSISLHSLAIRRIRSSRKHSWVYVNPTGKTIMQRKEPIIQYALNARIILQYLEIDRACTRIEHYFSVLYDFYIAWVPINEKTGKKFQKSNNFKFKNIQRGEKLKKILIVPINFERLKSNRQKCHTINS